MSKLWKVTSPNEVFYTEDAREAEFCEVGRGYKVELYTKYIEVKSNDYRETHSPIFNVSLNSENAGQVLSDMLMECTERLGNFPDAKVDPRAWKHLLVYIPMAFTPFHK